MGESNKQDKGTCPFCGKEFVVTKYGFKIPCPKCKGRIDIFPDMNYIETKFGILGISTDTIKKILEGRVK